MLDTSRITHHYPTGLALRAALPPSSLSLQFSLPLSVFDASWVGERDGAWGGGWEEAHSADVRWREELTCSVQNVSQCLTLFAHMEEELVVQRLAEHQVVHYLADEERHRLISQKLFGLLRWFGLLAYINLTAYRCNMNIGGAHAGKTQSFLICLKVSLFWDF